MAVDSSKQLDIRKEVGKLKRTHKISKLIQLVDKATRNFVAIGEQIANENPEFQVSIVISSDMITRQMHDV